MCPHHCAYTVSVEPEQLPGLETFPQLVANLGIAELRYRRLDDFERLYIEVGHKTTAGISAAFMSLQNIYGLQLLKDFL